MNHSFYVTLLLVKEFVVVVGISFQNASTVRPKWCLLSLLALEGHPLTRAPCIPSSVLPGASRKVFIPAWLSPWNLLHIPASVDLQSFEHSTDILTQVFGGVRPSKNKKAHLKNVLFFVHLFLSPQLFAARLQR